MNCRWLREWNNVTSDLMNCVGSCYTCDMIAGKMSVMHFFIRMGVLAR